MPKVSSSKSIKKMQKIDENVIEPEPSIDNVKIIEKTKNIERTPKPLGFSLYSSSKNIFADNDGQPWCPDCEETIMINKNGVYVCDETSRLAITENAAKMITSQNYILSSYIFPICDSCNRSLMGIVGNESSVNFGKLYFSCSCATPFFVMVDKSKSKYSNTLNIKEEATSKVFNSLSESYQNKINSTKSKSRSVQEKAATIKLYSTKI